MKDYQHRPQTIRNVMKAIREGKQFAKGFITIAIHDHAKDTFLVDSLSNGTPKRGVVSASAARTIIKNNL